MASSPQWKVYDHEGEYVASFKYIEHAAMFIVGLGDGAGIRLHHMRTVWKEGSESQPASESYDFVAETVQARIKEQHQRPLARAHA
jgi:hypothetical protein